jgi:purine-nucleoside phosphorylase
MLPKLQYHNNAKEGDIAPYVLLTGDPGWVNIIAAT